MYDTASDTAVEAWSPVITEPVIKEPTAPNTDDSGRGLI